MIHATDNTVYEIDGNMVETLDQYMRSVDQHDTYLDMVDYSVDLPDTSGLCFMCDAIISQDGTCNGGPCISKLVLKG